MLPNETNLLRALADQGQEINSGFGRTLSVLLGTFQNNHLFHISVVHSLTWSGYATENPEYYKNALFFLSNGDTNSLMKCSDYAGKTGGAKLLEALNSWNFLLSQCRELPLKTSALTQLKSSQNHLLAMFTSFSKAGQIKGIGAWGILAPFKVLLTYRNDLWAEEELDQILLPLGSQVEAGLKKLKKVAFNLVSDFDQKPLDGDLASVQRAQEFQTKLAKLTNSKALHINTGLHRYGSDGLEGID